MYFWRDHTGHEIDVIGEWGGYSHAMEIKCGETFQESYIKTLQYFMGLDQRKDKEGITGYLIYTGIQEGMYKKVALIPMDKLHAQLVDTI